MNIKKKLIFVGMFVLLSFSVTIVTASPVLITIADTTDDVEWIKWGAGNYNYQMGDFEDSIDIISVSVEEVGDNIVVTITLQGTPVLDIKHSYFIWIPFGSGTNWVNDEGARFITGGWGYISNPVNEIRVWADMTNDSAMYYLKGVNPSANGNNLSWTTPTAYWDDLSNINNWKVTAWTWASETTTPSDSETKGESYWDYYPNGDSPWEEQSNTTTTTTTIETTTGTDNGTPGFESFIAIIAINLIILVFRKKRK